MRLRGSTILVTGGARRIGRSICLALAGNGCSVIVHYHESDAESRALISEIECAGGKACRVRGDLAGEKQTPKLLEKIWREYGPVDGIVNNAAVFLADPVSARDENTMRKVNLRAPVLLTECFAMKVKNARRTGCVVNLLDQRVRSGYGNSSAYTLTKRLLSRFTEAAAIEYSPYLRVNGVAPGAVLGPVSRQGRNVSEKAGQILLGRRPTAEDVAQCVVFMLEADSVTGQTIFVDAGQHLIRESSRGI